MEYENLSTQDQIEVFEAQLRDLEREHLDLTLKRDHAVATGEDPAELDVQLEGLERQVEIVRGQLASLRRTC